MIARIRFRIRRSSNNPSVHLHYRPRTTDGRAGAIRGRYATLFTIKPPPPHTSTSIRDQLPTPTASRRNTSVTSYRMASSPRNQKQNCPCSLYHRWPPSIKRNDFWECEPMKPLTLPMYDLVFNLHASPCLRKTSLHHRFSLGLLALKSRLSIETTAPGSGPCAPLAFSLLHIALSSAPFTLAKLCGDTCHMERCPWVTSISHSHKQH